jgi:hypothetical protein
MKHAVQPLHDIEPADIVHQPHEIGFERISLFPPTPAIPNEDPAVTAQRTAKFSQAPAINESFDNQGRNVLACNSLKNPQTVLADISRGQAQRQKNIVSGEAAGLNDPFVEDFRRSIAANADAVSNLLQVNHIPHHSRLACCQ